MFDYTFLKIVWWIVIGAVLIIYASTAGFDAGVTMVMPFLKSEDDRRVVLNTSAPVWDGNQTWIVFAGGGLFVVWPAVYSTAFSGLYAAMLCILWALFLRPPGYDYRSKLPSHTWKRFWDFALLTSAFLPVFMFGVAFGNCFLGFPFYFQAETFRVFYPGHFYQLLSGFGILAGLTSVLMVLMHGAAWGQRRTENHLRQLFQRLHYWFTALLFIAFTVCGYLLLSHVVGYRLVSSPANPTLYPLNNVVTRGAGAWVQSYQLYPWKYFAPLVAYGGMIAAVWANYLSWYRWCFWASVFAVGGVIATAGVTLFPFIMPSLISPNQSLTVWNATSSQYALNIMLYVGVILLMIILGYKIFAYHTIWSAKPTLSTKDIHDNEHTFY